METLPQSLRDLESIDFLEDDDALIERLWATIEDRMVELVEGENGLGGLTTGQQGELRALLAREVLGELRFTVDPERRRAIVRQIRRLITIG